LLATLSAPLAGQAQLVQQSSADIPRLVQAARGTVVLIKAFDRQGKVLGLGSGFRIAGGRFVTNAHVVAGAGRVEIFDDGGALLGIARFAEMLSTTVDLAILPSLGARTPALYLAQLPPAVGEQVIVIGAPEGLTNTVSDGIVSAVRKLEGRQLLQISAPISPGSSGGPVLNRRGEVIGVSVSIMREGQNLNFAVPVADVVALVASAAGQFEFPASLDEPEHASSSSEESGRKSTRRNLPPLAVGSYVTAAITPADRLSNGIYATYHRLTGVAGTSVSIEVSSGDFDPFVAIYRFDADSIITVTADDDSGGGLAAKATLTFSGSVDHYYVGVMAATGSTSKIGSYNIRIAPSRAAGRSSTTTLADGEGRWVSLGRIENGGSEFDRLSVTSAGYQTYLYWERETYDAPQKDKSGARFDVVMVQYELSCSEKRFRTRSATQYLKGKVVWSSTWLGEWDTAIPETVGEVTMTAVCTYATTHGL
jgi:hypothetical protein